MSTIDKNAKYRPSHEWARREGNLVVIGISDHAQHALGDIVFVELPETGKVFKQGDTLGVVESVKAASDIYMPLSGKIAAVNGDLAGSPDLVNKDCYGSGWFVKIEAAKLPEWDGLLTPEAYEVESGKEE
ncbi:MAG: glycine cleavage system protein GcvH [Spirochaetes bacterium]|nr:glycine cleavage system protein GcvH [Spirochaetota bacterium]